MSKSNLKTDLLVFLHLHFIPVVFVQLNVHGVLRLHKPRQLGQQLLAAILGFGEHVLGLIAARLILVQLQLI